MKKDEDRMAALTPVDISVAVVAALREHFSDWRKFEISEDEADEIADLVLVKLRVG